MSAKVEDVKNNFESLADFKISQNSKGFNTDLHVYQGATLEIIRQVIDISVSGYLYGQEKLNKVKHGVEE